LCWERYAINEDLHRQRIDLVADRGLLAVGLDPSRKDQLLGLAPG
jgi:hypothetical protein